MKKIHTLSPRKDVAGVAKEIHNLLQERLTEGTAVTVCTVKDNPGGVTTNLSINKAYDMGIFHEVEQGELPKVLYNVERLALHTLINSEPKVYDLSKMWVKFEAQPYMPLEDRRAIDKATAKNEEVQVSGVLIPAHCTVMVIPKADVRTVLKNMFLSHVWNHLVTLANPHISGTYSNHPAGEMVIKTSPLNRVATTGLPRTPHVLRSMNMRKLSDVLDAVTKELREAGVYTTSFTVNERYRFKEG
nr:MAG TPA: hypothetical protein [Caudoviricetes sp.]